jgi:hypothetical protein
MSIVVLWTHWTVSLWLAVPQVLNLLRTYDLIFYFLLSQHKTNLNHDVFGTNTFLTVIGVMYCLHIAIVYHGLLVSKDHRLYHKSMSIVVLWTHWTVSLWLAVPQVLNLLRTYDLIFDFLLSQHKTNLNHDVFDTNTFLIVIGVMYCLHITVVYLSWSFKHVYHS